MATHDHPVPSNVAMTLSQDAAAALNSVFKVPAFVPGFPIGTGFARAIRQQELH